MHPDVSLLEARRKLWIVGDSRDNKKSKKIPIGRATGDRNPVRVTALLGDVLFIHAIAYLNQARWHAG